MVKRYRVYFTFTLDFYTFKLARGGGLAYSGSALVLIFRPG